jgi:tetratricopeptide (TPR) repeat protein
MYKNQWEDIFNIESDVVKQIARELKAILSPEESKEIEKNPTNNFEAYQLYLKGRWFLNKWTEGNIQKGMEYYEKAIELDPEIALGESDKGFGWLYKSYSTGSIADGIKKQSFFCKYTDRPAIY